jgi:transcription antitermination factor NusG
VTKCTEEQIRTNLAKEQELSQLYNLVSLVLIYREEQKE